MPTTPPDGSATRARLLEAGEELFSTLGFRQTTTPQLASRAGVAEGTIYRHFTGKDQLLAATCRRAYDWALDALTALEADRVRRAPERLAQFARQLVEEAGRNPARVRLLVRDDHLVFLDRDTLAHRQRIHDALAQLVAGGKGDGLVRTGPAELWALAWYGVVRLAAERVAAGEWEPGHPSVALLIDAAWRAIEAR